MKKQFENLLCHGRVKEHYSFTLIELLVVIAIIAILAAILLPALNSARDRGYTAQCLNNFKQLGVTMHQYHDDFDNFPSTHGGYYNFGSYSVFGGNQTGWFEAFRMLYIGNLETLRCPGAINYRDGDDELNRGHYTDYSINACLGRLNDAWPYTATAGYTCYEKISRVKNPSSVVAFADAINCSAYWSFAGKVTLIQSDWSGYPSFIDSRFVDLRHGQDALDPNKGGACFAAVDGHAEYVVTQTDDADDTDTTRPFYLYNIRAKK